MKAVIKYGVKLPIDGIQFSNVETAVEWELEGEAVELEKEIRAKVQGMVDDIASSTAQQFKTVIQKQNEQLEKAREEYLRLKEETK